MELLACLIAAQPAHASVYEAAALMLQESAVLFQRLLLRISSQNS